MVYLKVWLTICASHERRASTTFLAFSTRYIEHLSHNMSISCKYRNQDSTFARTFSCILQ